MRSYNLSVTAVASLLLLAMATRTSPAAESEQLTFDGRMKFTPVFRDHGRELLYADQASPSLYQLRWLKLADLTGGALHPNAATSEFEPAWSTDGDCYAYLKTRSALNVSVVVCDKRGSQLAEFLPGDGFCGFRSPALAPDHSRVAFSYAEKGSQQIFTARHNGGERTPLASSRGINNWPSFSPDGRMITFGSSRDGNFEIYSMNVDGSGVRRLTDSPYQDIRPRFSPDGKRIAFTSHRDGNAEIYVIAADGSAPRRVTGNPERDDYADWHPDGKRLVIVSERQGKYDLHLIAAEP